MTIDLDQVWDLIKPRPLTLRIDGVEYPVRRLLVADARRLSEFPKHKPEDNQRWLGSMFGDRVPPCVKSIGADAGEDVKREMNERVGTIIDAIATWYLEEESPAKKSLAAHQHLEAMMLRRTVMSLLESSSDSPRSPA